MNDNSSDNNRKKTNSSAKRKLIVIIFAILGVMIVLIGISFIIDAVDKKESDETEIDYNFYPVDYEENIFDDPKYVELTTGQFIMYTDSTTNVSLGITQDNAKEQGSEVKFLVDMIYDIIYGDAEAYNSRFSSKYYETHLPKENFTMQKIYDVRITFVSKSDEMENNDDYTKSQYCVEYKIYENNGSFRRDIGSGSKKQYFTLNTYSDGTILIDNISTVNIIRK